MSTSLVRKYKKLFLELRQRVAVDEGTVCENPLGIQGREIDQVLQPDDADFSATHAQLFEGRHAGEMLQTGVADFGVAQIQILEGGSRGERL